MLTKIQSHKVKPKLTEKQMMLLLASSWPKPVDDRAQDEISREAHEYSTSLLAPLFSSIRVKITHIYGRVIADVRGGSNYRGTLCEIACDGELFKDRSPVKPALPSLVIPPEESATAFAHVWISPEDFVTLTINRTNSDRREFRKLTPQRLGERDSTRIAMDRLFTKYFSPAPRPKMQGETDYAYAAYRAAVAATLGLRPREDKEKAGDYRAYVNAEVNKVAEPRRAGETKEAYAIYMQQHNRICLSLRYLWRALKAAIHGMLCRSRSLKLRIEEWAELHMTNAVRAFDGHAPMSIETMRKKKAVFVKNAAATPPTTKPTQAPAKAARVAPTVLPVEMCQTLRRSGNRGEMAIAIYAILANSGGSMTIAELKTALTKVKFKFTKSDPAKSIGLCLKRHTGLFMVVQRGKPARFGLTPVPVLTGRITNK